MRGGDVAAAAPHADEQAGIEAGICPLCGGSNQCAMAAQQAASGCWCMQADIAPAALAAIPSAALDRACLCPRCAAMTAPTTPPAA
ncbi:cysteine-rich CWC family protein [Amantichitinum ursilacus]|uniref:Cysteine-rich CWC n=1 Tax=Amantichitinum ursilacus TaxID=857265 RepID=A0A0N0XFK0_9NEIS|nr:cysteine-rich CWC family protein [Amantichitinum ursilacus]KPC49161.1 hypothetical protein WG78_21615 [Amantichitinum ursilacus]